MTPENRKESRKEEKETKEKNVNEKKGKEKIRVLFNELFNSDDIDGRCSDTDIIGVPHQSCQTVPGLEDNRITLPYSTAVLHCTVPGHTDTDTGTVLYRTAAENEGS